MHKRLWLIAAFILILGGAGLLPVFAQDTVPIPSNGALIDFGGVDVTTIEQRTVTVVNTSLFTQVDITGATTTDLAIFPILSGPSVDPIPQNTQSNFVIGCAPTAQTPYAGSFTITYTDINGPGQTASYPLQCQGTLPVATLTPPSPLALAASVGQQDIETITIQNTGDSADTPLNFSATLLSGSPYFSVQIFGNSSLQPNETGFIAVTCNPTGITTPQTLNGSLRISHNGNLATNLVDYNLTCDVTVPVYDSTLSTFAPDPVNIFSTSTAQLTINNIGNATLNVSLNNLTNNTVFAVDPLDLPAAGVAIAPAGSLVVDITCTPTTAGTQLGTLTLNTNDPNQPTVNETLTCNAVSPLFELEDTDGTGAVVAPGGIIDLGSVPVGALSPNYTITMLNSGPAGSSLDVTTVTMTGTVFTHDATSPPYTLAGGGGSQPVILTCTPLDGLNQSTLSITITIPPNTTPQTVTYTVQCTGVEPNLASPIPPGPIDFGAVALGTVGTISVPFTNDGTADLIIDTPVFTPNTMFSSSSTFPITIAPGTSQSVQMSCDLTAETIEQPFTGTLDLNVNDPDYTNPIQYNLTCNGVGSVYTSAPLWDQLLTFGPVVAGSPVTRTIRVTNGSPSVPLIITPNAITGADSAVFTYTNVVAGTPITIPPLGFRDVTIRCLSATATGSPFDAATASINHNAPNSAPVPANYPLSCTVVPAGIQYASTPAPGNALTTVSVQPGGPSANTSFTVSRDLTNDVPPSPSPRALSGTISVSASSPAGGPAVTFNGATTLPFLIDDGNPAAITVPIRCQAGAAVTPGTYSYTIQVQHSGTNGDGTGGAFDASYPFNCIVGTAGGGIYAGSGTFVPNGPNQFTPVLPSDPLGTNATEPSFMIDIRNDSPTGILTITSYTTTGSLTAPPPPNFVQIGPLSVGQIRVMCPDLPGSYPGTVVVNHDGVAPGEITPETYTITCLVGTVTVPPPTATIPPTATLDPTQIVAATQTAQAVGPTQTAAALTQTAQAGTPVPGGPVYQSNPSPGNVQITVAPNQSGTASITITEGGTAALQITGITSSGASQINFTTSSTVPFTIADNSGQSLTINVTCNSTTDGVFDKTITVTHNASGSPANYNIHCTVSTASASQTAQATQGTAAAGLTQTAQTALGPTQCPPDQVLSRPFPQNANGEFLLVNVFCIGGPSTVNITLTQVLTNPRSGVTSENIGIIQGNAGLMSVWRMGSWFLVPSTYNAANSTYTFNTITGTQVYAFFYGAITRPVGSQGTSTTTAGTGVATTATGDVADTLIEVTAKSDKHILTPRNILITTGVTLLLTLGIFVFFDRKRARRAQR